MPMPELWFVLGLAMGIIVAGFTAVGSFDRGVASVRRRAFSAELSARRRAVVARSSSRGRTPLQDRPERLEA
jgi:hypothetical protein